MEGLRRWGGLGGNVQFIFYQLGTRAERRNLITIFRYKFAPRGSGFDGPIK